MTRFWKEGFSRTSSSGTEHWVAGHWVERTDWERGSFGSSPSLRALPGLNQNGRRANFTTPNASCPICGARVFFYCNEYGSRVFFDELGPPWPKHPCLDVESGPRARLNAIGAAFRARNGLPSVVKSLASTIGGERVTDQWRRAKVVEVIIVDGQQVLTAQLISSEHADQLCVLVLGEPLPLTEDDVLFIGETLLSYFDFGSFNPLERAFEPF